MNAELDPRLAPTKWGIWCVRYVYSPSHSDRVRTEDWMHEHGEELEFDTEAEARTYLRGLRVNKPTNIVYVVRPR